MRSSRLGVLIILILLSAATCQRKSVVVLQEPVRMETDTLVLSGEEVAEVFQNATIASDSLQVEEAEVIEKDVAETEKFPKAGPSIVVSLEKTGCYGQCPAYEARLMSDGRLSWWGKQYLKLLGRHECLADSSLLPKIIHFADSIQFYQLADHYPEDGHFLPDLPSTLTYLVLDEQRIKVIRNNFGGPKSLRAFENFLEQLFLEQDWQEVLPSH